MINAYCGHCKKTVAEIVFQTGGALINHYCLERARFNLAIEKTKEKNKLVKYLVG